MARWSSTGRSRVAMTTLTLGRASDMVRPVRVAVAQAQRAGDEGNDLPVAGRELGLPGLVEADVDPRHPGREQKSGGGVLGGVDHDPGAGHLADGPVKLRQDLAVTGDVAPGGRPYLRRHHRRDVAVAVDLPLEGQHLAGVDLVPSAEGGLADPGPELAVGDGHPAAAQLAVD